MTKHKQTTYERWVAKATEAIETLIAKGVAPWESAIHPGIPTQPCNALTGRYYSGGNALMLHCTTLLHEYDDPRWVTYKQAAKLGGHVRKGQKGTPILVVSQSVKKDEDEDGARVRTYMRGATVFNATQCDGLPEPKWAVATDDPTEAERNVALLVENAGARVRHPASMQPGVLGSYSPELDEIHMCQRGFFKSGVEHAKTLLHEVAHWTGHESRLDRKLITDSNSESYIVEELVAELTAWTLSSTMGLDFSRDRSARYIDQHRDRLPSAQEYIEAAKEASHACKWLVEHGDPEQTLVPRVALVA